MDKFAGKIGFAVGMKEGIGPNDGIVKELPMVEKPYYGDIIHNSRRFVQGENVNDDIRINVRISIIADEFAEKNMYAMKYAPYMGTLWKVESVDPQRPRIIISLGGVYNGPTA